MSIYSVTRYGNDIEGPDGTDTEFIVLSDSVENAANIIDEKLKRLPHKVVKPYCHAVAIIGKSYSEFDKPTILIGPVETTVSSLGLGISSENIWKRCELTGEGPWIPFNEYHG